jgi:hypothetical protein
VDKDTVTVIVAAGGWIIAAITLVIGYLERRSAREEDQFAKTLDYFEGGSQRRSIGISMLEGMWLKKPRYHDVVVPIVANQIVYLLLSTDSHDAHNERNLVRLIMAFSSIPNLRDKYHDRWADVCDAIARKYEGESKGIPISQPTLKLWAKGLGHEIAA